MCVLVSTWEVDSNIIFRGAHNSAGECHPYTVEVAGSIPAAPTKKELIVHGA